MIVFKEDNVNTKGKNPSVKVGDTGINKKGTRFVVIKYENAFKVRVKFLDEHGFEKTTYAESVRKGSIDNPYDKTQCGIGYLGEGKYKTSEHGKPTLAHISWSSMMKRSYSECSRKTSPSYDDVTVCDDWHCFDTYAEWFYQKKGWDKCFQLDKDILAKGVRVYSPETCCLVPREINTAVKYGYVNEKGLLAGVSISSTGKFIASLNIKKKKTHVGVYDTQEKASAAYIEAKERYVKNLALEWANRIEWEAFVALMNWTVYP